jgi:hypothetical protein
LQRRAELMEKVDIRERATLLPLGHTSLTL